MPYSHVGCARCLSVFVKLGVYLLKFNDLSYLFFKGNIRVVFMELTFPFEDIFESAIDHNTSP